MKKLILGFITLLMIGCSGIDTRGTVSVHYGYYPYYYRINCWPYCYYPSYYSYYSHHYYSHHRHYRNHHYHDNRNHQNDIRRYSNGQKDMGNNNRDKN